MRALMQKLQNLGAAHDEEHALVTLVNVKRAVRRGEDIVTVDSSATHLTVLLEGLACGYKIVENGRRQILAFQYPGDFCNIHNYVLPTPDHAVSALTDCSVGIIPRKDIERSIARFPNLGLVLWRDTMIESRILSEWLLNVVQRPALERIAHLLYEQIVRLEAIGLDSNAFPLTQVDLADAAGLSPVHMNRTIQDLRHLGVLLKNCRAVTVARRDLLAEIAKFDGRYLQVPHAPVIHLAPSAPITAGSVAIRM